MELINYLKNKPQVYGLSTACLVGMNIICLSLPYWMSIHGHRNIGLYQSAPHGSQSYFDTSCNSDTMSETECGYLAAAQICGVLTVLFGAFSAIIYFLPPKTFSALPTFLATTGLVAQVTFSLMTVVIFYYFRTGYYDDDGVNREYPSPDSDSIMLDVMFYLWIASTVISILLATSGYYLIHKTGYSRKGALGNHA